MHLYAGTAAESTDGPSGQVADIVVDPVGRCVTHLVVRTAGAAAGSRLVPVAAVAACPGPVVLSWSREQIAAAPMVQEVSVTGREDGPEPDSRWDVGVIRMLPWPHTAAPAGVGYGMWFEPGPPARPGIVTLYDRIPVGTAEIRRASQVIASDDHVVGHVHGLVLDSGHRITGVILDRGHLWNRRDTTVPVGQVESLTTDRVRLLIPRSAIEELPSAPFHRRHRA